MHRSQPLPRLAAGLALALLASCGGGGGGGGSITLRYQTTLTDAQRSAFESARSRMQQVITGGWKSVKVSGLDCAGGPSTINVDETINGLVIEVFAEDLGTSGILAQSGPCIVRQSDGIPLVAVMVLNSNDSISWGSRMPSVVLHEMFHALGYGTIWDAHDPSLVDTTQHVYTGAGALAAAKGANGAPSSWTTVPVENTGTTGTIDAHWRESVFGDELMTGYITGTTQPLSLTTIRSMADLGYTVDGSQADAFTIPFPNASALEAGAEPGLQMGDDLLHVTPAVAAD